VVTVSTDGVLENPYNTSPGPASFNSSTYYKPTKITTHHSKKYYQKKKINIYMSTIRGKSPLYTAQKWG
jgi:hypothetical protein